MKWVAAVSALMLSGTAALGAENECTTFAHETNPAIKVTVNNADVVIDDNGDKFTWEQTITKPYGQPITGAIESLDANAPIHYFQILDVNGRRTLIFDSQIFLPVCD